MAYQWTPYHAPIALAVGLTLAVAWLAWRERDTPGATPLALFALAACLWSVAELGNLTVTTRTAKVFWTNVEITVSGVVAAAWLLLALEYTGRRVRFSRRLLAAVAVEPLLMAIVVWTEFLGYHGLVRPDVGLSAGTPVYILEHAYGPAFYGHIAYSYLLVLVGIGLMLRTSLFSGRGYRVQSLAFALAAAIVLGANAAYVLEYTRTGFDPSNIAFAASGALLLVGILRQRALSVVPAAREIARDELISTLPDAVVVVDDRGQVVDLNAAATEVFDVGVAEAVGRPLATVHEALTGLEDDGDDRPELVLERHGEQRIYDVRRSRLRRGYGLVSGALITLRDVTERRRTEERFQTLIERSRDVITVLDPETERFVYVSPSVEHVLDYHQEDLVGEPSAEYVHPEDVAAARQHLLHDDGEEPGVEFRFRHADGSWRWFEAVGRHLTDGPIQGLVINARDVTDRKRREEQVTVMRRLLRHNLRNDMNVIRGHVENLARAADGNGSDVAAAPEVVHDRIETVVERSDKLGLIDEIRRHESTVLDLTRLLEDVVVEKRQSLTDVDIELDLADALPIRADDSLRTAVQELLDNAVEHGGEELTRIHIVARRDGEEVVLRVHDDGAGIPDAERKPIEDRTETPLEHASGVGLWLVNWIVTRVGGDLGFEEDDAGTTVVVRFPYAREGLPAE